MVFLKPILDALNFENDWCQGAMIHVKNDHAMSSDVFAVTSLASSSVAAAGLALTHYAFGGQYQRQISVDQHLAYRWFSSSARPQGWALSSPWDDIAGDYQTSDGFIRLHTNALHHRQVVTNILGDLDRAGIAEKVANLKADELETMIVENGGAAARMMNFEEWATHPQGMALSEEPLIAWRHFAGGKLEHKPHPARPLDGLKVLDLTRIIAGPVATRFLAQYGANVLRIDPKGWDEGEHIIDMIPGKSCATLDLKVPEDLAHLKTLISQADVLIHGYRADALERLGLDGPSLRALNPSLIDIAHNAYGWSGPWRNRRGFDSLVQMSTGIADWGMHVAYGERPQISQKPRPMSVQALDHATGYLIAASALRGLSHLRDYGEASSARLSLARTAEFLKTTAQDQFSADPVAESLDDISPDIENTPLGPIRRLKSPLHIDEIKPFWSKPAGLLHQSRAEF
ncbi:MAG: CoA transferase [Rhizobiaceae bacterium]|nr:CoA transferase [Rhizobiaceae bacterium]